MILIERAEQYIARARKLEKYVVDDDDDVVTNKLGVEGAEGPNQRPVAH